jgi:hypothetical protein
VPAAVVAITDRDLVVATLLGGNGNRAWGREELECERGLRGGR